MHGAFTHSILVVCENESCANDILTKLFDNDYSVVGPATTAKMALALAAQTETSLSVIAEPPTGRRKARELARELMDVWGIRTLILEKAREGDEALSGEDAWAPQVADRIRLEAALGRA